jgi:hypothetical protein
MTWAAFIRAHLTVLYQISRPADRSFDMDQCGPVATQFDYIFGARPKRVYQFSGALKQVLVFNRIRL